MTGRYLRDLRSAITGAPDSRFVFLCNFEAETDWAVGHSGLPSVQFTGSSRMVHRMEELGVLLAGEQDLLVLSQDLDPGYRDYLYGLDVQPPDVLVPAPGAAAAEVSTSQLALGSETALATISAAADIGAMLLPMGTTAAEQKLAEAAGIPLAVPEASVFENVNGKIFGRRVTEMSGLRAVPGYCCETVAELESALADAGRNNETVVVKDSFGVSGKGMLVCDSEKRARQLMQLVRRRATRTGDDRIEVVVEVWLPKRFDMNYQITVARTGSVTLDFVKQAVTDKGVHLGHRMPVALDDTHRIQLEEAAAAIGSALYRHGYWGVAGIDAVMGIDDVLYPVLEINARLNMSSYQGSVTERFQRPGQVGLARYHGLRLSEQCPFERVQAALGDLLTVDAQGELVVVTGFGTVNANCGPTGQAFDGRLYVMEFADDESALQKLDDETARRLNSINVNTRGEH